MTGMDPRQEAAAMLGATEAHMVRYMKTSLAMVPKPVQDYMDAVDRYVAVTSQEDDQ